MDSVVTVWVDNPADEGPPGIRQVIAKNIKFANEITNYGMEDDV